jgi:cytochrome c oxidase subunit II
MTEIAEWLRIALFLPPPASSVARNIDHLHMFVITTTMVGAALITLVGGWFLIRFRRGHGREPTREEPGPTAPPALEALVVFGLFGLFIAWWYMGFKQYTRLRIAPENAMPVYVTAKQWMWKFAYPEGAHSIGALVVPAGRPVKLIMTSRDVIHSFYVPDFRTKQDVLPGRYTTLWFEPDAPGKYQILCAEFCGTNHSRMRGEVVALAPADFARWLEAVPEHESDLTRAGERAAAEHGCLRCHTLDGSPHIGPTWSGLFRSRVPLEGGGDVLADEAYLTESMMDPAAKRHAGFALVMPSYQGRLPPSDAAAIVELIRSLRDRGVGAAPPPNGTSPWPVKP